jgi:hypothetical protein
VLQPLDFEEIHMNTLEKSNRKKSLPALFRLALAVTCISGAFGSAQAQWSTTGNNTTTTNNVGIGTTTPVAKVDVTAAADTAANIKANISANALNFNSVYNNSNHAPGITWSATNLSTIHPAAGIWAFMGGSGSYLHFGTTNTYGGITNTAMTVDYAGSVGIGTEGPYSKLHVYSTTDADGLVVQNGTASNGQRATIYLSTLNSTPAMGTVSVEAVSVASAYPDMVFRTAGISAPNAIGTERMRITSGGNIGIGASAPTAKLQLASIDNGTTPDIQFTYDGASYRNAIANVFDSGSAAANKMKFLVSDATTTGKASVMTLQGDGNVGIGTTSPSYPLQVFNPSANNFNIQSQRNGGAGVGIWTSTAIGALYTTNNFPLELGVNGSSDIAINTSHNVGIGTSPGSNYKLDVSGNVNISGPSGSGNLTVSGNINAKYQDVAEWVPASEQLSAGTVVVLDSTKSNQVTSSSTSYDTRVAGVVSEQPGIALGEKSEGKVLVATTGRVRVKVDATKGPIHIGDLLVTSDVPGVAMKSEAVNLGGVQFHRPGTLIGKALEPLTKGSGSILVLLSLQ